MKISSNTSEYIYFAMALLPVWIVVTSLASCEVRRPQDALADAPCGELIITGCEWQK